MTIALHIHLYEDKNKSKIKKYNVSAHQRNSPMKVGVQLNTNGMQCNATSTTRICTAHITWV